LTVTSLPSPSTPPASSPPPERPVLSVAEAAELLGVSQWLVLQQVGRGAIPHKRVGRRILFPRAVFLAWLESTDSETSTRPEVPLRLAAGKRR
jgi:excisionase family DNA binding protein